MGSKQLEVYNLLVKRDTKKITEDIANLKIRAIKEDAYLYPGWNYTKYPQADLSCGYEEPFTNELFEEGVEDVYGDPILVFIKRCY